jgi:hypothetical protein
MIQPLDARKAFAAWHDEANRPAMRLRQGIAVEAKGEERLCAALTRQGEAEFSSARLHIKRFCAWFRERDHGFERNSAPPDLRNASISFISWRRNGNFSVS